MYYSWPVPYNQSSLFFNKLTRAVCALVSSVRHYSDISFGLFDITIQNIIVSGFTALLSKMQSYFTTHYEEINRVLHLIKILILLASERSERDTLSRSSMENAIRIYIYIYIYIGT